MIIMHTIPCSPSQARTIPERTLPSGQCPPRSRPHASAMRQCMRTRALIPPLLLRRPMLSGRASR